jgi:hypothetical protein
MFPYDDLATSSFQVPVVDGLDAAAADTAVNISKHNPTVTIVKILRVIFLVSLANFLGR